MLIEVTQFNYVLNKESYEGRGRREVRGGKIGNESCDMVWMGVFTGRGWRGGGGGRIVFHHHKRVAGSEHHRCGSTGFTHSAQRGDS